MLTPLDWTYTAIWNVLENPVTSVPMGLDAQGLPLGIQVVGRHGHDHVPIAVAQFLENTFGGWVPPWAIGRP
jgi:fatty acid amide hydrolase 2